MSNSSYIKVTLTNTVNVTKIVTILSYELSPTYKNSGERHDFWEIVYVDRGEISCRRNVESNIVRSGEIIFHSPNEFHSIECNGCDSASVFIVTFDCKSPAMRYFNGRSLKVPANLRSLIKRLTEESEKNFYVSEYPLRVKENAPIGGQQLIRVYLEELLIQMMRSEEKKTESGVIFSSRESLEDSLVRSICDYLAQNVDRRVTLEEMSEHFHFGKSHLCDVFKKTLNDTIINYHTKLKIEKAKSLLKSNRMNISEVASTLGFENPEYFTRCFKKHAGVSPRAFRARLIPDATVYLDKEKPLV